MSSYLQCKKKFKTFICDASRVPFCKECSNLAETDIKALVLKNRRMRFYCKKCGLSIRTNHDRKTISEILTEMNISLKDCKTVRLGHWKF